MNKQRRNRAKEAATNTGNVAGIGHNLPPPVVPVAWRIDPWCEALGMCRAQFYKLYKRGGIDVVKIGTMTLVLTAPADYLAWAAAQQPQALQPVGRRRRRPSVAERTAAPPAAEPAELPVTLVRGRRGPPPGYRKPRAAEDPPAARAAAPPTGSK